MILIKIYIDKIWMYAIIKTANETGINFIDNKKERPRWKTKHISDP